MRSSWVVTASLHCQKPQAIKWELAEWLERLTANANAMGTNPASSETVEFWRMADEGGFELSIWIIQKIPVETAFELSFQYFYENL